MPASTRTGLFDQRYDHDYFKVTLVAGERYLFRMLPGSAGNEQRPALELFAPGSPDNGFNPTASDTRVLLLAESGEARFAYTAEASGTYFLRASLTPINAVPRTDSGSYTVSAETVALDDHADLPALGTALAAGATLAGSMDLRRDLDFFSVNMAAGQRLLFSMNGSGGTPLVNNSLSVRSPSGDVLVQDSVATSSGGAKIAFVAPAAGVYQVLARAWPSDAGSGLEQDVGGYSLAAASVAADDHSDIAATGSVLAVGATLNGAFDLRHDLDHFRVTLVAGQRYLMSMNGAGATPVLGSTLALFGPSGGDALVTDTATTASGGAKFSFVAPQSGTFDLLATLSQGASSGNGDTGGYAVSLASLAADDHADLRANGTVLAIGATLNGQFDQRYDLDTFRVNLVEGQRYTFTMTGSGATPIRGALLQLLDPDGNATEKVDVGVDVTASIPPELLPFLPPGLGKAEAKFVFTASATGTHYLLAQVGTSYAGVGSATGSYTLAAASKAADDFPDRHVLGSTLAANTTVNGSFDFRHDVDYFRLTLNQGQRYLFTLTPTAGGQADVITMTLTPGVESHIANDISTSTNDPAKFAYVAPLSGTYYLRVEGQQAFSLSGAVTQTYTLNYAPIALDDHSDLRDDATVLLAGPAPNQPPQVTDGSASTAEDLALAANLPSATDADGGTPSYAKASDPAHGTVVVNANGSYTYTPAANYHGSDAFTFTVSDGQGGSVTRSMSITVTAVNDAPVRINAGPALAATAGTPFTYTVAANVFSDADGDPITLTAAVGGSGTPLPAWLSFNPATRVLSGTPGAGDVGSFELRIRGSDGQASADDYQPFTVSAAANVAPVAAAGSANGVEDQAINGSLPAASDGNGDAITYAKVSEPAHGTVVVNANGSYTYTPAANYHGSDSFSFSVSDGRGGSNSYAMALSLSAVNDAPVRINAGPALAATAGAPFSYTVAANVFSDADGDPITLTAGVGGSGTPLPAWLSFNPATRVLSGTPGAGDAGSFELRIRGSDGQASADDYQPFTVTLPPNVAPVAADGAFTMDEDTVFNGLLPAASDANGDAVSYAMASVPAKGFVTVNPNGSFAYAPNGGQNGSDSFSFTVSDARGGQNTYTQRITITPVNDAPIGSVAISGTASAFETLMAAASLVDQDGMGTLSYQWLRGATPIVGATASSYTLTLADVGQAISARVSYIDGGGTAEAVTSAATALVASGINLMNGTAGPDSLVGTAGRDSVLAGAGDDYIRAAFGSDTIDGGVGYDVASFVNNAAVNVDLRTGTATSGSDVDQLINIEVVFGSSGNDTLRGIDQAANVQGDRLRGGIGSDVIDGGTGVDTAEYQGARSGYQVQRSGNTITVTDIDVSNGNDGIDSLIEMERLIFADQFLAFGTRAEELARVAFVLWSPEIVISSGLFCRGYSFYDSGHSFATMCRVALQFHEEQGEAFATKLVANIPGTTRTVDGLLTLMLAAGGGDDGRAAAVAAMAMDDIVGQKLIDKGVIANGVVGSLVVDGFGQLFGLMPGA